MNSQEAKNILALFRPGSADETDPAFQEARQLAKTEPELARWFNTHCEAYLLVRQRLQTISIPPALKEQILSERKIQRPIFRKYWTHLLAAAAVVVVLVGLASDIWPFQRADRLAAYRKRMTETALRNYYMDLTTNDLGQIRNFLKANGAPADYSLPAGLDTAKAVGCAVSGWRNSKVSMICFKTGRPLASGDQSDLWLFVIDRKDVANAPPPGALVFDRVNKATTASWSDERKTYLLAAVGEEAFLRKYLQ